MTLKNLSRVIRYLLDGTLARRLSSVPVRRAARKRLAWWEAQVGRVDWVEMMIQQDVRMRLHFNSHISGRIYAGGFELAERQFVNAFLRSGDIFVDVGANAGLYTLIAARGVSQGGRVYAFEPCFTTHQRLAANVHLNAFANVECYQVALSDREGVAEMYVSKDGFDAQNSFTQPDAPGTFERETVDCITWDAFAEEHDLVGRVAMIKIDAEGWEYRILRGGQKALSRADAPVLQMEFHEQALQSSGSSCQELYQLLEELGYGLFAYDPYSKKAVREPPQDAYPCRVNLIAARHRDQLEARLGPRVHGLWLGL